MRNRHMGDSWRFEVIFYCLKSVEILPLFFEQTILITEVI